MGSFPENYIGIHFTDLRKCTLTLDGDGWAKWRPATCMRLVILFVSLLFLDRKFVMSWRSVWSLASWTDGSDLLATLALYFRELEIIVGLALVGCWLLWGVGFCGRWLWFFVLRNLISRSLILKKFRVLRAWFCGLWGNTVPWLLLVTYWYLKAQSILGTSEYHRRKGNRSSTQLSHSNFLWTSIIIQYHTPIHIAPSIMIARSTSIAFDLRTTGVDLLSVR